MIGSVVKHKANKPIFLIDGAPTPPRETLRGPGKLSLPRPLDRGACLERPQIVAVER